jgi:hypothetical protein
MAARVWRNSNGLPIVDAPAVGQEMDWGVGPEHFAHYGVTRRMLAQEWDDWSIEDKKVVSLAVKSSVEDFLRQASRFLLASVPGFLESERVQWAGKDCVDNTSVEEVGGALGWSFGESVLASAVRVPSTHDCPCDASHYVLVGDTVDILSVEPGQGREHRFNREVYGGHNSTGMSKRQVSDDLTSKADARNRRMNEGVGAVNVNHIVAMAYARNDRDRVAARNAGGVGAVAARNARNVRARHH